MKFASVDEFLSAQTPTVRASVESLRSLVMDAEPRLVEIVKWNSPSYVLDGADRLTINVGRNGAVVLVLHRGVSEAEVAGAASSFTGDPAGLLTWHSDIRASVPASSASRDVVRAWLAWSSPPQAPRK